MESEIEYDLVCPIKSFTLNANYIPLGTWKKIVLRRIHVVERSTFHAKSWIYSKLNLLKVTPLVYAIYFPMIDFFPIFYCQHYYIN